MTLKGEKVNSEFGTTEMPFVNTPFFPSQLEAKATARRWHGGSGDVELYLMTARPPRKFKAALRPSATPTKRKRTKKEREGEGRGPSVRPARVIFGANLIMTFFCCAVSIARPFSRELGTFRAEKRDREGETIEEQKSPPSRNANGK